METPDRAWNDARLDDLSEKKVDGGFAKVDATFGEVRSEMKAGFDKADEKMAAGFAKVDKRFEQVDAKMQAGFDRLDNKFDWQIRVLLGAAATAILTHVF